MNAHKVKLPATTIYMKFGGKKSRVKLNRASFPAELASPVPKAVVSLCNTQGQWSRR